MGGRRSRRWGRDHRTDMQLQGSQGALHFQPVSIQQYGSPSAFSTTWGVQWVWGQPCVSKALTCRAVSKWATAYYHLFASFSPLPRCCSSSAWKTDCVFVEFVYIYILRTTCTLYRRQSMMWEHHSFLNRFPTSMVASSTWIHTSWPKEWYSECPENKTVCSFSWFRFLLWAAAFAHKSWNSDSFWGLWPELSVTIYFSTTSEHVSDLWSEFWLCFQQVGSGCACFWVVHISTTVCEIQHGRVRKAPLTIQGRSLEAWAKFTSLLHWNELVQHNLIWVTSCLNWWAQVQNLFPRCNEIILSLWDVLPAGCAERVQIQQFILGNYLRMLLGVRGVGSISRKKRCSFDWAGVSCYCANGLVMVAISKVNLAQEAVQWLIILC